MQLELSKIRCDGGTQPRAKLSEETICEYADDMRNGDVFKPVTVFFDGKDYWLADGFHRVEAKRRLDPDGTIEVEIHQGTLSDAQWHSFSVNKSHGLRRTNGDKKRAVRAAIAHPRANDLSNCQVAEHCGVDEKTIRKYRISPESTSEIPKSDGPTSTMPVMSQLRRSASSAAEIQASESRSADATSASAASRPRTGRDGRTINTAKIGRQSSQGRKVNISGKAFTVKLGHSPPNPMIPLQFSPNNAHTAAATLFREFTREWCETLIQDLTRFLSPQEASV